MTPLYYPIIELAWEICRRRARVAAGPEPSRWRFFAHRAWEQRCLAERIKERFARPTKGDIYEAADELGIEYWHPDVVAIIAAHDRVHSGCGCP